jgi:integrase
VTFISVLFCLSSEEYVCRLCRIRDRRHTLATDMLRQGCSLDEIGELLRHQSPNTTAIYAKVDLAALHTLALPWPGGGR